jgi:hypothetical protein
MMPVPVPELQPEFYGNLSFYGLQAILVAPPAAYLGALHAQGGVHCWPQQHLPQLWVHHSYRSMVHPKLRQVLLAPSLHMPPMVAALLVLALEVSVWPPWAAGCSTSVTGAVTCFT